MFGVGFDEPLIDCEEDQMLVGMLREDLRR
jgi:hypothetical protein